MTALPTREQITDVNKTKPEMLPIFGDFRDFVAQLLGGAEPSELTIADGAISPTAASHSVDTEGDAPSDNLDRMSIDDLPEGSLVRIYPANAARVVTIRDQQGGDGEFVLRDGDFAMADASCLIELQRRGTQWVEQWREDPSIEYLTEGAADALYAPLSHDHDGNYAPLAHTHSLGDISGAGALAAGDDAGDVPFTPAGAISATDVQAAIQELDSEKQAAHALLSALAGLSGHGMVARTGTSTFSPRAITGTTSQISVSNGDGVSGNPTISAVIASQAEAEAGSDNTKLMTPQRVAQAIAAHGGATSLSVAILQDQKPNGTDGGGSTAGSRQTRDLNTEVYDPDGIVTLSSNKFTPVTGTYIAFVDTVYTFQGGNTAMTWLYNETSAADVARSLSIAGGTTSTVSNANSIHLVAAFTANGTDAYRIDGRVSSTRATDGFGIATGFSDGVEVYNQVILIKIG